MVEVVVVQQLEVVLVTRAAMLVEILQRKIKIIDIMRQANKLLNVCSIRIPTTVRQVTCMAYQKNALNVLKYPYK